MRERLPPAQNYIFVRSVSNDAKLLLYKLRPPAYSQPKYLNIVVILLYNKNGLQDIASESLGEMFEGKYPWKGQLVPPQKSMVVSLAD